MSARCQAKLPVSYFFNWSNLIAKDMSGKSRKYGTVLVAIN